MDESFKYCLWVCFSQIWLHQYHCRKVNVYFKHLKVKYGNQRETKPWAPPNSHQYTSTRQQMLNYVVVNQQHIHAWRVILCSQIHQVQKADQCSHNYACYSSALTGLDHTNTHRSFSNHREHKVFEFQMEHVNTFILKHWRIQWTPTSLVWSEHWDKKSVYWPNHYKK